jgi:hypothetical protein
LFLDEINGTKIFFKYFVLGVCLCVCRLCVCVCVR